MATKWKNIIETGKRLLKQQWQVLVSVMLAGCGIFTFYILIAYRTYYPTEKILYFGILGNILLGSGTAYLLEKGLNRKYQNWIPKEDVYYREWRAEMKKMEHLLQVIGILAFAAAGIFFVLQSKFREYWSWYYNYAAGYMMLFTALLQYMVWQFVRRRFDEKKREVLMGKLEEINQKRIAEALENEKKSLAKVSRSDQLRIDLITNVSHDLKTPLTSMVGYIELIKKEELSDLVRDYVDVLSERAEKLKEMINSLFSLAKASSGNIELHPEKFELNRLADQRDLKVETAVFKVFPCRNGASEGALELVAAVNIVDRHSAHHISRKRDQAASSGDRVDKSRNEEERAEPDQIMDVFHGYPPCILAAGRKNAAIPLFLIKFRQRPVLPY